VTAWHSIQFSDSLTQYTRPAIQAIIHVVNTFQNSGPGVAGFRRWRGGGDHECAVWHTKTGARRNDSSVATVSAARNVHCSHEREKQLFRQNVPFRWTLVEYTRVNACGECELVVAVSAHGIRQDIQHIPTWWFEHKRAKFTPEKALSVQTGSRSTALLFL